MKTPPQFTPREINDLKDVIILHLVEMAEANYEGDLHAKLVTGKPLDQGECGHYVDLMRRQNLPDRFRPLLEKLERLAHESTPHPASSAP